MVSQRYSHRPSGPRFPDTGRAADDATEAPDDEDDWRRQLRPKMLSNLRQALRKLIALSSQADVAKRHLQKGYDGFTFHVLLFQR